MALVKAVPDDAVPVEITEMVNAGTFWVKSNTQSKKWNERCAQLEAMEMFLAKAKLTAAPKRQPPGLNELVAVNNCQTGKWNRGRIKTLPRFGEEDYQVFLIDHGRTIEVPASAIKDIDEFYTKQEQLAFMIILFGIVPANSTLINSHSENLTEMSQWSFQANMFVQNQIAKSSIGYFCQKDENAKNNVKRGELYLVQENGFIDLGLLLLWQNYAMPSKIIVKAEESYSNSNEKNCVMFQDKLKGRKEIFPQNQNHPVGKEVPRRIGIDIQKEKQSALKTVTDMCESLRLQESLQTDTRAGSDDKLLKTQHKPYKCKEIVNVSKIVQKYGGDEEEEEEEKGDLMSNLRKSYGKELQKNSMEEGEFYWKHTKENRRSQQYYLQEDEELEDISGGVKFDGRNVEKTALCFDRATENSHKGRTVELSVRYSKQDSSDEYKSYKPKKYGSPLGKDNVVCDERNVIKKPVSRDDDSGNWNYPKSFKLNRKCDVSMESHDSYRRDRFYAKHGISKDNEKSYKGGVKKKCISENDLRNKIKYKETFDSVKYSEKIDSLKDEMFDENSSNCARVNEKDMETPLTLPYDNPKIISSKRSYLNEIPENELKNDSIKFSAHGKNDEDFDSGKTSSKTPSVKGRVKSKPILTFFPAGFNMHEADLVFAEKISPLGINQKGSSNSFAKKGNSLKRNADTRSPGCANRNTKKYSGKDIKLACEETDQQNKLERKSYNKQNKMRKHMYAELDEENLYSFNIEKRSREEEIEIHLPTNDRIITSPPNSKRHLRVDSSHTVNYSSINEDHESHHNFYRTHKKDASQMIEFVSNSKHQQNEIVSEEQNEIPKHMNAELGEEYLHSSSSGEHYREKIDANSQTDGGIMTFPYKRKPNHLLNSLPKSNCLSESEEHKSLDNFHRKPKKEFQKTNKFVPSGNCQRNRSELWDYGKQKRSPKHTKLDESYLYSRNSEECSKEKIEVNPPTRDGIMTFLPKTKHNHSTDSTCMFNHSSMSEDHECPDNFYTNPKKDACQMIEFVSNGKPHENKLESMDQNKFPKHMNAELNDSNSDLFNLVGNKVRSSTSNEVGRTGKLVVSHDVDKSCVPEFSKKVEEMKLEYREGLDVVPSPPEFKMCAELETSDTSEKTLSPQKNIIERRFSPEYSGQQMQSIHNSIMNKDISFPQTSDRTERTPVSQELRLCSAIQEYITATSLAQNNETNKCVPLLQQLLQNLSAVSVEGGAVNTEAKSMVNTDIENSETSKTAITDSNIIINCVETIEHTKKSITVVTSELTDAVSPVGLPDMQNVLQKMTRETLDNTPIIMFNEVSEQKLKDSEPNEVSSHAERNISEFIQVGGITEMTDSVDVCNGEADFSEILKMQNVESVIKANRENVSEQVLLKEDFEVLVGKDLEAEVVKDLRLVEEKDVNLEAGKGQSIEQKGSNVFAQNGLNVVDEVEKAMKNSLNIVVGENTNIQVEKSLNGKEENTLIETKEDSNVLDVIESTSCGEVDKNINAEAKGINIEVEESSLLLTKKDMIVTVDKNTETMIQKSYEMKIKGTDIAEDALMEDSNIMAEESPKEGVNILVKDEIENAEDQDTAVLMKKSFMTKRSDIETKAKGQDILKAPVKDETNTMKGDPKCVMVQDRETILKTMCTEPKEVVEPVSVEVSKNCDCPETKVMMKGISQTSQICSSLDTSDESHSISEDVLESNSSFSKSSSKEYETVTPTDTSRTVNENLIEGAQISEEQNLTGNAVKCSIESDVTEVSEKPPPHRIIRVEPDLFCNAPRRIIDQLQMTIVLLHGAPEGFRHLNAVTDAAFRMDVHEVLKTIMFRMMRIQKYAWPLILQGYSVVMVGPPVSGKTLGYAVPLLDMVMQNVFCNQIPKGNGPVMLILCSGSKSCNEVESILRQFINKSSRDIKILVAYSGGAEKMELKLVNGCHILITTPRCFKRLYGFGKVVINFLRLKYLVLDDADVLTLRFLPEIEFILKCLERDMKSQDKAQLQVVAAAKKWCPGFDELVKNLIKPVVCIAAFLETLVYAHLKPHVFYVTQSNRIAIVKEIVEKSFETHRTLILCREVDEVKTLKNALKFCPNLLYVHDNMDAREMHGIYLKWSYMTRSVLVCTDNIFQEMPFLGVSQIIHFSLGNITKREFAFRCSAIIELLPSVFQNQEKKKTDVEPQMHIFICDTDSEPLPTLVRLLKRLGVPVDPDLQKRANEAEYMKELCKTNVPLCYNTKAFGDCWNRSKCIYRHVISNKDRPQNIPVSGNVKVKILYIHDACNYSARLMEHVDKNGEVKAIPNCLVSLAKKLRLYFKVEEHRILLENPKAHDLCAFEKHVGMFLRTEILAITKADRNGYPTELLVRYIDDGGRDIIKADEIFVLPDDLKEIPPQAVELYLCRLVPCDLDWSWGSVTNKKATNILAEADEKGRFLIGKIKLSLGHTLWLDPLECFESLGMLKTSTIIFSLRRKLLDEGLAVENPQHLQILCQACIKGGLDVSCTDTSDASLPVIKSEEKEDYISWAHLPVDEFSLVYFIVGDHPGRFYVRLQKFEDLVNKLDKKLLKFVKEKGATDRTLFTGDYCVGRFPADNRWYRARVEEAQDDTLDLFFVDHGDRATVSRSEAIPLPKNLISQLPFQAIECCFAGVGPDMGDMWSEESIDTMYGIMCKPGAIGGVKSLYAKVMDRVKPADCTGGYKYHLALIEVTPHGQALLNDSLLAWNVATQTEEQKLFLKRLDFSHLVPPLDLDPYESEEDEDEADEPHSLNEVKLVLEENWDDVQEMSPLCTETVDANISDQLCISDGSACSEVPEIDFDFDAVTKEEWNEFYEISIIKDYFESQEKKSENNGTSSDGKEKKEETELTETLEDSEFLTVNTCDNSTNSQDGDLNNVLDDDCTMPPLERESRTPLIYWHQNAYFVWLRVDLPGVEKYHLKWDTDKLHFWTVLKELIYTFDLNLFGPINPSTLNHFGGLFVRIKMEKVAIGMDWPRLTVEQMKCQWIKHYYQAENDVDVEDLHISEQLRVMKKMEEKTAARKHGVGVLPADEVPYEDDDDDDSDSCCSDIKLPGDEQYDPYDPLN